MLAADIRINARLTDQDAVRYRELLERSGLPASALLRAALREYHAAHAGKRPLDPLQLLSGYIGAGAGPEDLSSDYKRYLGAALEDKPPLPVQEPVAAPAGPGRRR